MPRRVVRGMGSFAPVALGEGGLDIARGLALRIGEALLLDREVAHVLLELTKHEKLPRQSASLASGSRWRTRSSGSKGFRLSIRPPSFSVVPGPIDPVTRPSKSVVRYNG